MVARFIVSRISRLAPGGEVYEYGEVGEGSQIDAKGVGLVERNACATLLTHVP